MADQQAASVSNYHLRYDAYADDQYYQHRGDIALSLSRERNRRD